MLTAKQIVVSLRALSSVLLLLLSAQAQQRKRPAAPPSSSSFEISGTLVNAITGEPVFHAKVEIGFSEKPSALQTTLSGPDGHFAFHNLSAAKYWLAAAGRGYMRQGLDEHDSYFTGVAVGPGQDTQNINFRLRPDGSISGDITDNNDEPVAGAPVMLFRSSSEEGESQTVLGSQTSTDDQGAYRFSHLTPGKYFVAVSAQPWYARTPNRELHAYVKAGNQAQADASTVSTEQPADPLDVAYPVTFYPGVTDPGAASAIDLPPGDRDTANISINAVPAVHLSFSRASSEPGGGGGLVFQEMFGNAVIPVMFAQQNTDPSGQVEVSGVAPGHYVVADAASAGKAWRKSIDVGGDAEIDSSGGSAALSIGGLVQLDGKPVPDAVVRLRNHESAETFNTQTSATGDFAFEQPNLTPGTYEVSVAYVPDAAAGSISATGAKVQGRTLQIAAAGEVHLTITMTKALGRVEGVAQRDGKPMGGAMVVLVPQQFETNASLIRRDQSDSDGTFTLPRVLPGKYTVVAIADGWSLEWLNPSVLGPYLKAGTPVEVAPGRKYSVKVKVQ